MSKYVDIKFSSIMEEENDGSRHSECILENSYFYVFWWLNHDYSIKTLSDSRKYFRFLINLKQTSRAEPYVKN